MELSKSEVNDLIREITVTLNGKLDGGRKNIIAESCPYCGKSGKYGVYVGQETERKKVFMANCFSCGRRTATLAELLHKIDRPDLMPREYIDVSSDLDTSLDEDEDDDETQIDDSLHVIELPDFYKRLYFHRYLFDRGIDEWTYEYFEFGSTNMLNFKFQDYIIIPIYDNGDVVGYVARHTWSKAKIAEQNMEAKVTGEWQIRRYNNSTDNEFSKLLYNYDAIIEDETDTVIIVEGVFDVIGMYQTFNLFHQNRIAVVATFGKKISEVQAYKIQSKGVENIVIGYDGDAVDQIKKISKELTKYFDVMILDNPYLDKDWADMDFWEAYDIFSDGLMTPVEYDMNKVQEYNF